jgi:hypothetical protein
MCSKKRLKDKKREFLGGLVVKLQVSVLPSGSKSFPVCIYAAPKVHFAQKLFCGGHSVYFYFIEWAACLF